MSLNVVTVITGYDTSTTHSLTRLVTEVLRRRPQHLLQRVHPRPHGDLEFDDMSDPDSFCSVSCHMVSASLNETGY